METKDMFCQNKKLIYAFFIILLTSVIIGCGGGGGGGPSENQTPSGSERDCFYLRGKVFYEEYNPFSGTWPFTMELGYAYPIGGEPYFIGIPESGTIESEPSLFSGSFFLNQFWSFTIESPSQILITFGVKNESMQQILTLELYTNDNILILKDKCKSGDYIQLPIYLFSGKYIIKIKSYENNLPQSGYYWIVVED